jgi:DNA polymerase zeta
MMFVKPTLRKSLLAKMLAELLDTRVMIKSSMKGYKADKVCLSSRSISQRTEG